MVVGIDGKTYTPPAKKARPRSPLPDTYQKRLISLKRKSELLLELSADDRWSANREVITGRHGPEALHTLITVTTAVAQLDPTALAENEKTRQWWLTSLNEITEALSGFGRTLKES